MLLHTGLLKQAVRGDRLWCAGWAVAQPDDKLRAHAERVGGLAVLPAREAGTACVCMAAAIAPLPVGCVGTARHADDVLDLQRLARSLRSQRLEVGEELRDLSVDSEVARVHGVRERNRADGLRPGGDVVDLADAGVAPVGLRDDVPSAHHDERVGAWLVRVKVAYKLHRLAQQGAIHALRLRG